MSIVLKVLQVRKTAQLAGSRDDASAGSQETTPLRLPTFRKSIGGSRYLFIV